MCGPKLRGWLVEQTIYETPRTNAKKLLDILRLDGEPQSLVRRDVFQKVAEQLVSVCFAVSRVVHRDVRIRASK